MPARREAINWGHGFTRKSKPPTPLYMTGYAHSVEAWEGGTLVGGLYGVLLGRCFFGESMFSIRENASKVALVALADLLIARAVPLIDCQVSSPHLRSLGAREIPRGEFFAVFRRRSPSPTASSGGPFGRTDTIPDRVRAGLTDFRHAVLGTLENMNSPHPVPDVDWHASLIPSQNSGTIRRAAQLSFGEPRIHPPVADGPQGPRHAPRRPVLPPRLARHGERERARFPSSVADSFTLIETFELSKNVTALHPSLNRDTASAAPP